MFDPNRLRALAPIRAEGIGDLRWLGTAATDS
jgi:hypothetical protein